MKCLKCGLENRNDVKRCVNCSTPMTWTPDSDSDEEVIVRVSRVALTAIILALCSFVFVFLSLMAPVNLMIRNITWTIRDVLLFTGLVMLAASLILGFVSLIQIEISGGKKTGTGFAVGAIILSILAAILPIWRIVSMANRGTAINMYCGTNLSGIGKAMLIYANDYGDALPRAGGRNSTWGTSVAYNAANRMQAYAIGPNGTGGSAAISSSLYLLVKYAEVTPRSFICPQDRNVSQFVAPNQDLVQLWDFGSEPWKHNSYAYQMPYSAIALTTSDNPATPIAADRNPWMPSPGWGVKNFSAFNPDGNRASVMAGNSFPHQDEGQNVLYLDTHMTFENSSSCGINMDNIYSSWNGSDIHKGKPPKIGYQPVSKIDSMLVNDPPLR